MDDMNRENYDGGRQDAVPEMMEEVNAANPGHESRAESPCGDENANGSEETFRSDDSDPSFDEDSTYPEKSNVFDDVPSYPEERIVISETPAYPEERDAAVEMPVYPEERNTTVEMPAYPEDSETSDQNNAFPPNPETVSSGSIHPSGIPVQNVAYDTESGFERDGSYSPNAAFDRNGSYNPNGTSDRTGTYDPNAVFGQNKANASNSAFYSDSIPVQNGANTPNGEYSRNGAYNAGGLTGQGRPYNPGGPSDRNGAYNPGGTIDRSGAYNSGSASDRNGTYNPGSASDRNGAYPRHGAYGQNGPGNRNVPHGGSETRKKGYSSRYDSYRFETPPVPTSPGPENEDRGTKKKRSENAGKKKAAGGNTTAKKAGLVAGLAVLFGLVASLVFLGATSIASKKVTTPAGDGENAITAIPTPSIEFGKNESRNDEDLAGRTMGTPDTDAVITELTVPQVVELCMPSMVAITNTTMEEYWDFFGGRSQQESVSAGSGIIVGETETELLIATNNHVVQNSTDITVTFIDDEAITGSVKGMDSDNDLAILAVSLEKIPQDTRDAIRVITIGDSDSMKVGESVVAIGNALGYGQSVSAGIISALGREVRIDGQSHALIQTDASINPGNSGGALINMRGELIGINEVKYVDETVEGVGYAIPMSTAKPILGSLGSKASRQKVSDDEASYIGIKCLDVPSYYVQSGYPSGVYVSEVTKGGPADTAGLKEGDIITAIDGIGVTSSSQLVNYLQYYAAGETIDFSVSRLNKDNTAFDSSKMPITLGSKKEAGLLENNGSEEPASPEEESSKEPAPDGQGNAEPDGSAPEEQGEDTTGTDSSTEEEEASEESGWTIGDGGFPFLPEAGNR